MFVFHFSNVAILFLISHVYVSKYCVRMCMFVCLYITELVLLVCVSVSLYVFIYSLTKKGLYYIMAYALLK